MSVIHGMEVSERSFYSDRQEWEAELLRRSPDASMKADWGVSIWWRGERAFGEWDCIVKNGWIRDWRPA